MTLTPSALRAEDVTGLRAGGVSDEGIRDALYVCVLFNIINRVADALGFESGLKVSGRRYLATLRGRAEEDL